MNQLSTDVKNQVIIFHDKSKKFVTKQQAEVVINQSTTAAKGIKIDGSFIGFSSISKILSLQEFYNQYPDERPAPTAHQDFTGTGDILNRILTPIQINAKRIRAVDQLIKGLQKYINSDKNQGTKKPEALLAHMQERLTQIYDNKLA